MLLIRITRVMESGAKTKIRPINNKKYYKTRSRLIRLFIDDLKKPKKILPKKEILTHSSDRDICTYGIRSGLSNPEYMDWVTANEHQENYFVHITQ